MSGRLAWCGVVGTVLLASAPAHGGSAAAVGPLHFLVPDGWTLCEGGQTLCPGQGTGRIRVKSPVKGSDSTALARAELVGARTREQPVQMAGQPATLAVSGNDEVVVVTAATTGGDGAVVTLQVPRADFGEAVHAWVVVVESATFGQPLWAANEGGPAALKLKNQSQGCAATMYFDGKAYSVPSAQTIELAAPAGRHVVEWDDGATHNSRVLTLTKSDELAGTCAGGTAPVASAQPAADETKAVFAGARAVALFYRGLWNLVVGGKPWATPRSLDRMTLKLLLHRTPSERRAWIVYSQHLDLLNRAIDKTASDGPGRTTLRRLAARILLESGQLAVPRGCQAVVPGQDEGVDCVLAKTSDRPTDAMETMNEHFLSIASAGPLSDAMVAALTALVTM